jgi:outer membrane receptor protein involved in Fe transport
MRGENMKTQIVKSGLKAGLVALSILGFIGPTLVVADDENILIDEIIVTATKRATTLQETPMSIQAFGNDSLSRAGIDDVTKLLGYVPGLALNDLGPGDRRYSIRGLQLPGEAQVGIYLDEMPLVGSPSETDDAGGSQPEVSYFDLQRIEVLKGPQGTLYGAGSQGGTIRILTNKPNADKIEGAAQVGFSNTAGGGANNDINFMGNIPIIENVLALRGVFTRKDHDGFIDDMAHNAKDVNDYENESYRLMLGYTPSDDFSLQLSFNSVDLDTGNSSEYDLALGRSMGKPVTTEPSSTPFSDEFTSMSLVVDYQGWSFADLVIAASSSEREVERSLDFSGGAIPRSGSTCVVMDLINRVCDDAAINAAFIGPNGGIRGVNSLGYEEVDVNSFEMRLSDKSDGSMHWLIGYFHQERDTDRAGQVLLTDENGLAHFGSDGLALTGFSPAQRAIVPAPIFGRTNQFTYEQSAVFGELSYDIDTQWTATVGLRWFDTEKANTEVFDYVYDWRPAEGPKGTTTYQEDAVIGRLHLGYQRNDNILLYGQISQGFRPGGPARPIPSQDIPSYSADDLLNYEFGWRAAWADGRATLNGAVYYIEWEDVQVTSQINVPTGIFTGVFNGGGADIFGIEIDANFRPTDSWEIGMAFNLNDGELTDDIPGSDTVLAGSGNEGFDGDSFPNVSQTTFSAYSTWLFSVGDGVDGYFTSDFNWTDGRTSTFSETAPTYIATDSYYLVNMRLGMETESWHAAFYARNLTDEMTETTVRAINRVPAKATTTRPRTIGVEVGYRF